MGREDREEEASPSSSSCQRKRCAPFARRSGPSSSSVGPTASSDSWRTEALADELRRTVFAVGVGATGALVGVTCGVALPWMLGAMASSSLASLAGARLAVWKPLKLAAQTLVGVSLGAHFTPEMLANVAANGPGSVAGLLGFTSCAAGASAWYLARAAKYDPTTAFFSGAPGGLNDMLAIGTDLGGDARTIGLTHACRLAIVLTVMPQLLVRFGGVSAETLRGRVISAPVSTAAAGAGGGVLITQLAGPGVTALDGVLLACAAVVGPVVGRALRLPARFVVGPMVCSAACHLCGATDARVPSWMLRGAQCVIATSVGVKFAGVTFGRVASSFGHAAGSTSLLLVVSVVFSAVAAKLMHLPWALMLLAYSPGGITEACVATLALGMDVGFVAAHHVIRITFLILAAPGAHRAMAKALGKRR